MTRESVSHQHVRHKCGIESALKSGEVCVVQVEEQEEVEVWGEEEIEV